ncbi:hypothetical protein [Meiothermus taiwanensis]|uniref:Lipoprotein n=2 Tax=Meiothermus taiwanensis TaxID=172827 RepID=A0A399DZY5_9DEIN|nr:hypothetical protein [Meiothermus taiwanensis]AWR87772.1 hypothetical protein Mtai_v1c25440 [Meiothermus taiwanensis WR-220]KIQ53926.1 hypothetical protein SY28_11360 [Meiothermus taiwanensis]KZK15558.1 hypothetical protein A3962_09830 [Meiothermus taiwanensis]RIH77867.1 hypothetical protein Mcate_01124 [Meiothermus taiwanensis]
MRPWYLALLLGPLAVACSGQSVLRPPSTPSTPGESFSLAADPFTLQRGGTATLTVRVTFNASNLTRVFLSYQSNTGGLEVTPKEQNAVRGSTNTQSATFTVTDRGVDPMEKKPFFYIYGIACTSNGCSGQSQRSLTIQWNMP